MNFTTSILAAGMLGFKAFAASDAFAAHRLALETMFEGPHHYSTPVHHNNQYHHDSRHYEHEYATYPHETVLYHDAPSHDAYDAYTHDQ